MSEPIIRKDVEQLTMTVSVDHDVTAERAWELWNDPRQLERWWGPPTYPATVVNHALVPGGVVTYYMTGPDGGRFDGWWRVLEVAPPRLLVLEDGFGDDPDAPPPGMPSTQMRMDLVDRSGGGVTMTITSTFPSAEAMEQLLEMGMAEGIVEALQQIDGILAVPTSA